MNVQDEIHNIVILFLGALPIRQTELTHFSETLLPDSPPS